MDGHQTASRRVFKAPSDTPRCHQVGQDLLVQYFEDIPTQNLWIVDDRGIMQSTKKYPLLHACTLADYALTEFQHWITVFGSHERG